MLSSNLTGIANYTVYNAETFVTLIFLLLALPITLYTIANSRSVAIAKQVQLHLLALVQLEIIYLVYSIMNVDCGLNAGKFFTQQKNCRLRTQKKSRMKRRRSPLLSNLFCFRPTAFCTFDVRSHSA